MSDFASAPTKLDGPARPFLVSAGPGRLLLLRVFQLDNVAQTVKFFHEARLATRLMGDWVVVCADYRPVRIFNPTVVEEMVRQITYTNSRVERSAVLTAFSHPTQSLQSSRIVKSAGLAERRQFTDAGELTRFLNDALNAEEQTRLREFLAEYPERPE